MGLHRLLGKWNGGSERGSYEDCFYEVPNSSTFDERFKIPVYHWWKESQSMEQAYLLKTGYEFCTDADEEFYSIGRYETYIVDEPSANWRNTYKPISELL